MTSRRDVLSACAVVPIWLIANRAIAQSSSGFLTTVKTEWIPGSRSMRLLEDFSYRDPEGQMWMAQKNWIIDGASIPRFLWVLAGSPFDPPYREASVIHDFYCDTMQRSWQKTHRVFYDAMITAGTGRVEATSKYWAVHRLGPRWDRTHRWSGMWPVKVPRRSGAEWHWYVPDALSAYTEDIGPGEDEREKAEAAAAAEYALVQEMVAAGRIKADDVPAMGDSRVVDR